MHGPRESWVHGPIDLEPSERLLVRDANLVAHLATESHESRTRHKETACVGRSRKLRSDLGEAKCRVSRPPRSTDKTGSIRREFARGRRPQNLSIQLEVLRRHDVPR